MNLEEIVAPLTTWYRANKRDLPWRKEVTPYKVWISEIMLQQTRVEAVKVYFERFMKEVPSVLHLSKIDDDQLLKLWEGLGYYQRARNLKKAAQVIMGQFDGKIPSTYADLISLPGIGSYTAGAIASLAFQRPLPAVDGNVLRVLSRVMGSTKDISREQTKKEMEQHLRKILKSSFVSDFNQGLMELGALICVPDTTPKCEVCPLRHLCIARKQDLVSLIPIKGSKTPRKKLEKTVLILEYKGSYAIEKRPKEGLLAGLYGFPILDGHLNEEDLRHWLTRNHIQVQTIERQKPHKHVFTHLEWQMIAYHVLCQNPPSGYLLKSKEALEKLSIPTAFQYFLPKKEND